MTTRERRRRDLLWTIHHWMRRYGVWFVFVLSFSVLSSGITFAAESKIDSAELMRILGKETTPAPAAPQALEKKKPAFTLPDLNPEDVKAAGEAKEAEGTISARNKYGMAVEVNTNERKGTSEDIWVTFHKKLKLSRIKDLSELGEGDKVKIRYKVTKDTKKILLSEIELLKKKPAEEPPVLVSEEEKVAS